MSTRQTCRAGGQCQTHSVLLAASLRWQELKFTKLSADLASLSHFVLAARPVVTDKVDVPAVAMEQAAPVTMSTASMEVSEEAKAHLRWQSFFNRQTPWRTPCWQWLTLRC
eukprot:jgi/Ulvmu1/7989/UM004_0224.1